MKTGFILLLTILTLQSTAQEIAGKVLDGRIKEPMPSVVVQVYKGGVLKGGNVTDYDGNFVIKPLDTGNYDMVFFYPGYDSLIFKNVPVIAGERTKQNAVLKSIPVKHIPAQPVIHSYSDTSSIFRPRY